MTVSSRRLLPALALSFLLSLVLSITLTITGQTAAHAAPAGASAYVPVSPSRILDTRSGLGFSHRVGAGETFTIALPGVPAAASAVVLNLAIDASADRGFVTVYPAGTARPTASSINVDGVGQTIANLVTVPLGSGGKLNVYSQMSADLIADVQGYYLPATTAQSGRFTPLTPTRLLDTRAAGAPHPGPFNAGESFTLNVAALGGVPADAIAAALNVTVTDSKASGFWTVFPAGAARPMASNINVSGAGTTIANQVIARLSGGQATIYSQTGGNLIVDLVGWFTGPSAGSSDAGLFVPVAPSRLIDTRQAPSVPALAARSVEVNVAGRFGVPTSGVGAVVINATVTQAAAPGYFTIWPAQTYRPTASSLNVTYAGETIANHVIAPVSTAGFEFFTQSGAHLLADITGFYTGTEATAVLPAPPPLVPSAPPTSSTSYAFTRVTATGPMRWNPCQVIHYSVNLGGYPEGERQVIGEALTRLQAATGLTFASVGDTTYTPTTANPTGGVPAGSDMVIALSDEAHTDLVPGSIVGRADISYSTSILRATVVIDLGDVAANPDWSSTGSGPVLLHELGHAVGLAHVADPTQIMNATATVSGPTTYAAGDLAGLWNLGAAQGCTA